MKQETKSKLAYKVVCNLNDADFYTTDKEQAIQVFEQYKEDYGDGIRLYEAETPKEQDEEFEWEIIDYYDEDNTELEERQIKKWTEVIGIVQRDHGEIPFMETAKELLKTYGPITGS